MVLENEITWFGATDTHSTTSPPFVSTPEIFLIYLTIVTAIEKESPNND